jgi:hypothetical protein
VIQIIGLGWLSVKQKSGCGITTPKILIEHELDVIHDFKFCGKVCGRMLENIALDV